MEEKKWFAVHTYSGYENKVKMNLEKRLESMGMTDKIFRVIVPIEEEIQIKDGKKKSVTKKVYPGYVMVEMVMSDDSWYVVRNTPGVTGFVGTGSKPVPLEEEEVERLLKQMGEKTVSIELDVEIGENIKVIRGPFEGFVGIVEEIDGHHSKLKVMVSMFGRETPLELTFDQVEKIED